MEKIINGEKYYLPSKLTQEQQEIYIHIIDWKRKNITTERGYFNGIEYDAIFPNKSIIPEITYRPIIPALKEMQKSEFAYKPHMYANHAISSQTACINLFMPLLMSADADKILLNIPGCPSDFAKIARDKLFHGFCFEYWGQDIKNGKGLLNDHSKQAGTDSDIAIAYYNKAGELCLWLIEHKLSEKEFTECGGYKSESNSTKDECLNCNLESISNEPQKCHYHRIGYNYWKIFGENKDKYNNSIKSNGCPFKNGLNQLWRNQLLAFALQETKVYSTVTFSVCHHAKNSMLGKSIKSYESLICNKKMFNSFTNYDVVEAVTSKNKELAEWLQWYKEVYCF